MVFVHQLCRYICIHVLTQLQQSESIDLAPNQHSSDWLLKNSLAAQKLTIFDTLAPASFLHLSQYVRILDKTVHARVSVSCALCPVGFRMWLLELSLPFCSWLCLNLFW